MDSRVYVYNDKLEKAVRANQLENTELLLKDGANPNYIICSGDYNQTPLLFLSPTTKMTKLLLQFDANPNLEECSQYAVFGQTVMRHISILQKSVLSRDYENIIIVAEHEPCIIHNNNINESLLLLLKENNNESLLPDFSWDSKKGKAIIALIRISTDLKQEITTALIHNDSPLSFAIKNNNIFLFELMIENNLILLEDLKYDKATNDFHQINEEFEKKLLEKPDLEKTFDTFFILFQLMRFGQAESKSVLYYIPKDIFYLITAIVLDFKIECRLNYSLSKKMQDFLIVHNILKTGHYNFSWDGFLQQNNHHSRLCFFYCAEREASQNKKGLTAVTLNLIKENKVDPKNEKLVNSIFTHCIQDKDISEECQKGIRSDIQKRLGK